MVRSMVALVAGYAVMMVIVMAGLAAWLALKTPGGLGAMRASMKEGAAAPALGAGYLTFNLLLSLGAAVGGGLTTVAIAASKPTKHLEVLGALVLVMGVLSAASPGSAAQPRWYRYSIPVVGALGVALAGLWSGGT